MCFSLRCQGYSLWECYNLFMKIISLLPAATEIVCLLGLEKSLVGVSDDSDFPEGVSKLPKVTTTTMGPNLSSLEIDKKVKAAKHRGSSVFHIDTKVLAELAPDLILTQELCPVCAPAFTDVEKAAKKILHNTQIISLEPHSIFDILKNIQTVGELTETKQKAKEILVSLQSRLSVLSKKLISKKKPSVLIIEWLDPVMIAGHWVPEMVQRAGGAILIAKKKEPSRYLSWDDVILLDPDCIIVAPCGFSIQRTVREISLLKQKKDFKKLKAHKNSRIFLVDGNAYLTRPGPRIIDGTEIMAEILHPKIFQRNYSRSAWRPL